MYGKYRHGTYPSIENQRGKFTHMGMTSSQPAVPLSSYQKTLLLLMFSTPATILVGRTLDMR